MIATSLQLAAFDPATGQMLADWSAGARAVRWSTNGRGFASLEALIPAPSLHEAWRWYDAARVVHVQVSDGPGSIWEGRLEAPRLTSEGLAIRALGYQRALSDVPYTALWIDQRYAEWVRVTRDDLGARLPDTYEGDNNNRLYLTPREGERVSSNRGGGWTYVTPHRGARNINSVVFDYSFTASSDWRGRFYSYDRTFGSQSGLWTLVGNGATQTGTLTISGINAERIEFAMEYIGALAGAHGVYTGDYNLKITGITVKTTASATLYADEVARALLSYVTAINPTQLSTSTLGIRAPAVALYDEQYADMAPAAILDRLAAIGDSTGTPLEWGVWHGRKLHFAAVGYRARTWYVDALGVELERPIDAMHNSIYGVYKSRRGQVERTTTATDSDSVGRWGITRRAAVAVSTTSETAAASYRDVELARRADPPGRGRYTFDALYNAAGSRIANYEPRAGDTIILRNLPPTLGESADAVRSFRIAETEYDADSDTVKIAPAAPLPLLEVLVSARRK